MRMQRETGCEGRLGVGVAAPFGGVDHNNPSEAASIERNSWEKAGEQGGEGGEQRREQRKAQQESGYEGEQRQSAKGGERVQEDSVAHQETLRIMSWNANSFLLRLRHNRAELVGFICKHSPDVIAIQRSHHFLLNPSPFFPLFPCLLFHHFPLPLSLPHFPLSPSPYPSPLPPFPLPLPLPPSPSPSLPPFPFPPPSPPSGAQEVRMPAAGRKGGPLNQSELKDDTKQAREERQFMQHALASPPFSLYRVWWSLAPTKYAGTAMLLKRSLLPRLLSASFSLDVSEFSAVQCGAVRSKQVESVVAILPVPGVVVPRPHQVCRHSHAAQALPDASPPLRLLFLGCEVDFSLSFFHPSAPLNTDVGATEQGKQRRQQHEADGRAIILEFPSLRLLNTYVPNNGFSKDSPSFPRRAEWDDRIRRFLTSDAVRSKPLIWLGDLNISRTLTALPLPSHRPSFSPPNTSPTDNDVSDPEFFRSATNGEPATDPGDRGQPGFSLNERMRFAETLKRAGLTDAYRHMHPSKDMQAGFTWSGNPVGRYRGKRMRVDYFCVSNNLLPRVAACDIHGQGFEGEGEYGCRGVG
ncbi:unnamed protein product [Closterium sp. NIES-65]|nr:unnamed protein product [Closterium sp. NIES-65]